MNRKSNTGAIKPMVIINIVLLLLIAVTIFYLLTLTNQRQPAIANAPTATGTAPIVISSAPGTISERSAQAQLEIRALKQQLEKENSKLRTLRIQQEQEETIRSE